MVVAMARPKAVVKAMQMVAAGERTMAVVMVMLMEAVMVAPMAI